MNRATSAERSFVEKCLDKQRRVETRGSDSHARKDEGQKTNQVAYILDVGPFFVYDLVRPLLDQSEERHEERGA